MNTYACVRAGGRAAKGGGAARERRSVGTTVCASQPSRAVVPFVARGARARVRELRTPRPPPLLSPSPQARNSLC